MKRRKKTGGAPKEQANAPEPLQPKYFESDVAEPPAARSQETPAESAPSPEPSKQPSTLRPQRPPQPRTPQPRLAEPRATEDDSDGRETQADFELGIRGVPELPLAAAVSGEGRVRPSRRHKKRGGRGGDRRQNTGSRGPARNQPPAARVAPSNIPTGHAPASNVAAGKLAADNDDTASAETIAVEMPPLTPESASELTPTLPLPLLPTPPAEAPASTEAVTAQAIQSAAVTPPAAVTPRPSKGTVVLAIGLPGSGKSSWFKRHNIRPLSSDLLRELLFDNELEQRFQDLVFSNLRSMLKARLIARRPMSYVDATNLTPHDRHSWIKLAKDYGYDVQGLFFDVPLDVCLERHQRRGRVVPEEIMRKMAGKLRPPTFEEGFSKITVVRVKQKDAASAEL